MSTFIDRINAELSDLNDKISKLTAFMDGEVFVNLSAVDAGLLMVQLEAMKMYSNTLSRRLEALGE